MFSHTFSSNFGNGSVHRQLWPKPLVIPCLGEKNKHKSTVDDDVRVQCMVLHVASALRARTSERSTREFISTRMLCSRPLVDSLNQMQNAPFTVELVAYSHFIVFYFRFEIPNGNSIQKLWLVRAHLALCRAKGATVPFRTSNK